MNFHINIINSMDTRDRLYSQLSWLWPYFVSFQQQEHEAEVPLPNKWYGLSNIFFSTEEHSLNRKDGKEYNRTIHIIEQFPNQEDAEDCIMIIRLRNDKVVDFKVSNDDNKMADMDSDDLAYEVAHVCETLNHARHKHFETLRQIAQDAGAED